MYELTCIEVIIEYAAEGRGLRDLGRHDQTPKVHVVAIIGESFKP